MGANANLLFCWISFIVVISSVLSDVWKVKTVSEITALVTSCVVVPCEFQYPGEHKPASRLRGIWHTQKDRNEKIYHEDQTEIADSFKGRTQLLGSLGDRNCTLEIDKVKDHDNGPFCFRIELTSEAPKEKYSFVENCVSIKMQHTPTSPELLHNEITEEGQASTFKCSVRYTCSSHPPTLTWNLTNINPLVSYKQILNGVWEVESLLTLTVTEENDHSVIACSAEFHGNKRSTTTFRIFVKRKANYLHIIIPVVAVLGTTLLFGGLCFFVTKKYKRQIQELQSRNENGMLRRLSRMSRRSNWSREADTPNRNNKPSSNVSAVSASKGFSKPRFPSPKSKQKDYSQTCGGLSADYDDDYTNMGDLNIYGNV